ncbi:MAG: ABC transporter ATP-binding protein [Promethearchaeota archaeon]
MVKSDKILINCINLSKQYGYFFALKNNSFNIKKGTIFGIAGANGAGKTTLIKILSGLVKPTLGSVEIGGMNYEDNSTIIHQNIGITTDESFLYEELTIFENLKFYCNLHLIFEKREIKQKIDELVEKFNLTDWINEPVKNLSHGMKQKVELIRTVIHSPMILFLDEPFSGLDYVATDKLIKFIKEKNQKNNVTIILTTHKIELFQQICNDLIILRKGKIVKTIKDKEFNEIEIESLF